MQAWGCVANNGMGKAQTVTGLVNVGVMNSAMVLEDILYRNDQETRSGHIVLPAGKKATEMQSAQELMEAYLERVKYLAKIGQVSWNIAQQVLMDHKPDPSNSLLNDETL